eukprot:8267323-Ditylum_brightwellii.AAC.1
MISPFNKETLGLVLGPAKGEGNEMAHWVLKGNGKVMPCQTLRLLRVEELNSKLKSVATITLIIGPEEMGHIYEPTIRDNTQ